MHVNETMPSILDREVVSVQADAFGHVDSSDALRSLIEESKNNPPYSIGFLGSWGTGKSSNLSNCCEDLDVETLNVLAEAFSQNRRDIQKMKKQLFRNDSD